MCMTLFAHRAARLPRILREAISDNAFAFASMLAAICALMAVCRAEAREVSVESEPAGALVTLDGLVVGHTPLATLHLPEGSTVLTVSLAEHIPVVYELAGLASDHDGILAELLPEVPLPRGVAPEHTPERIETPEQMVELVLEVATQLEVAHHTTPDRRALLAHAITGAAAGLDALRARVDRRVDALGTRAHVHYGAMPVLAPGVAAACTDRVSTCGVLVDVAVGDQSPLELCFGTSDSSCRDALASGLTALRFAYDPDGTQVGHTLLATMAIAGMLEALGDPHTHFFATEGRDDYADEGGGIVSGTATLTGSPADELGILPGTRLLSVDERAPIPFAVEDTARRLRGPEGSRVTLVLDDDRGGIRRVELVRELLHLSTASSSYFESSEIGYIRLDGFPGSWVADELGEHLRAILDLGARGLVLDLRGNAGGLLDQAIAIADMFLDEGIIVSTVSPLPELSSEAHATATATICPPDLALAVLVDQGSASASEVLAGVLQERGRAVIVGTRSYGKGTVQVILPTIEAPGALALSVGTYQMPSGYSLHGRGVQPDLVVEIDPELRHRLLARSLYARTDPREGDPQLVRALAHVARTVATAPRER
jgi:C-terminal peptidase prc